MHCHLLPGIDDGPATMDEALRLATVLHAQGVTVVAATPHVSHAFPNSRTDIVRAVDRLREGLADAAVPVKVVASAELSASAALDLDPRELEAHSLGGLHLLVEPPLEGDLAALQAMTSAVYAAGFNPVVAHPERMTHVRRAPDCLLALRDSGVIFQVTASSLVGRRRRSRDVAWVLVEKRISTVVASDAHGATRRPPALAAARELLVARLGLAWADHVTQAVPGALVLGGTMPTDPPPAEPVGRTTRRFRLRSLGARHT